MIKKRYDSYKDSGVEWIGEIPSDWSVIKLKYENSVSASSIDKKDFEWWISRNVINYNDVVKNKVIDESTKIWTTDCNYAQAEQFQVKNWDIIITKDSMDKSNIADATLISWNLVNTVYWYHLYWVRPSASVYAPYLYYYFQSIGLKEYYLLSATWVTIIWISWKLVRETPFLALKYEEQQAIASYLDEKTATIDELIKKKKKQIKLLEEKRTALINHAVTRWLDPDVELVDSGVEWIGKIPKGWEVRKVRYELMAWNIKTQDGNHWALHPTSEDYENDGIPFIMASDVRNWVVNYNTCKRIPKEKTDRLRIWFSIEWDILFTHKGTIGEVWIVKQLDTDYIMLTPQVTYYRMINAFWNNEWLYYYMMSKYFKNQLKLICSMQSTRDYIWLVAQKELLLVHPWNDAKEIIIYLKKNTSLINELMWKIKSSIDLLTEHKQSLISHVVTGKVKVF